MRTIPSSTGAAASHPGRRLLPALALLALVLVAYWSVSWAGFIWDDDDYVVENATLRDPSGLLRIWTDPAATPQYYPLVHTTFWIEYQLWGLRPTGYHLTNVLLHGLNAILVWRIFVLLGIPQPASWLAAAIFAVHPVHVESVAWITERKNVLSAAFGLGALLLVCRFFRLDASAPRSASPANRDWLLYAAATSLFAAALLSKTVLCSLPVVVWIVIWWRRGRLDRSDILPMLPWLALGAVSGLATAWLEKTHVGAAGTAFALSPFQRLAIAGRSVWFYWLKLAWPHPLAFMYPRWDPTTFTAIDLAYPVAIVLLLVGLALSRARIGRGPLAAVLCFLVTVFPALGFIDIYPMRYTFVADHYQYLASIAPLLLPAMALGRLADVSTRRGVAAATLLLFAALTARQATIYHGLESLWTDTLAKNPRCAAAHFHLGKLRMAQGRHAEAARLFADAERLEVDSAEDDITATLLGNALVRAGQPDEAAAHFERAIEKNPVNVEALNSLANHFSRLGQPKRSVPLYRRALAVRPGDAAILMNLGNALAVAGEPDAAIGVYESAAAIAPGSAAIRVNLAAALAGRGRFDEAVDHLQHVLRTNPADAAARRLLERIASDRERSSR